MNAIVEKCSVGNLITRYYIRPENGTPSKKIKNLELDLAYAIGVSRVEINIDSENGVITMDIVKEKCNTLLLGDCISALKQDNYKIPLIIGKDLNGKVIVEDLEQISNILVAGTTGSGKSNLLNTFIVDIIYSSNPEEVKMLLIDTRIINFQRFNKIPHLIIPVITDYKKACWIIEWLLQECMRRNELFAKNSVKNIGEYNEKVKSKLPKILVFIEDLCDMMNCNRDDIEGALIEIVKISRKVGIHLVISTYRTSTEIITGRIKANIPTRLTFKLPSKADSRTVIDRAGAEKLLPYGDALFIKIEEREPKRIQIPYISDGEIDEIVDKIKIDEELNNGNEIMQTIDPKTNKSETIDYDEDILLNKVIDTVMTMEGVSVTFIQNKFNIGYARAGRVIDKMEEKGIISGYNGNKERKVLVNKNSSDEKIDEHKQPDNVEKEQKNVESIKDECKNEEKGRIFRKWWFWVLVGIFLYVVLK